ncbi:competence protein ComK [Rossellomorea aquimaris]|uniref:competence protein ComK n=1 Tax=Rossellomorea aquimaris TaxID=189382 RepID=UPI001CD1F0AC|nr:competence protein ComK [Rossellomorea aquimaris]MCA1061442.1 competence protein ComK [Rossellomorea aquimaris]
MKGLKEMVTRLTTAISPAYDGIHQTVVHDFGRTKTSSKKSAMDILDESCLTYRSTYDGRIKAVRHAFRYPRKTPLMICPQQYIYAIPTKAPTDYDCIWLFCQHIESTSTSEGKTYVHFTNGEKLAINCSESVIMKQRERAAVTMTHFSTIPTISSLNRNETELYLPGFQSNLPNPDGFGAHH